MGAGGGSLLSARADELGGKRLLEYPQLHEHVRYQRQHHPVQQNTDQVRALVISDYQIHNRHGGEQLHSRENDEPECRVTIGAVETESEAAMGKVGRDSPKEETHNICQFRIERGSPIHQCYDGECVAQRYANPRDKITDEAELIALSK